MSEESLPTLRQIAHALNFHWHNQFAGTVRSCLEALQDQGFKEGSAELRTFWYEAVKEVRRRKGKESTTTFIENWRDYLPSEVVPPGGASPAKARVPEGFRFLKPGEDYDVETET